MTIDEVTIANASEAGGKGIDSLFDNADLKACTTNYERCDFCLKEAARIFAKVKRLFSKHRLPKYENEQMLIHFYMRYVNDCMFGVYAYYVLSEVRDQAHLLSPMEEKLLRGLASSAFRTVNSAFRTARWGRHGDIDGHNGPAIFKDLVVAPFDAALSALLAFHHAA